MKTLQLYSRKQFSVEADEVIPDQLQRITELKVTEEAPKTRVDAVEFIAKNPQSFTTNESLESLKLLSLPGQII